MECSVERLVTCRLVTLRLRRAFPSLSVHPRARASTSISKGKRKSASALEHSTHKHRHTSTQGGRTYFTRVFLLQTQLAETGLHRNFIFLPLPVTLHRFPAPVHSLQTHQQEPKSSATNPKLINPIPIISLGSENRPINIQLK